jgi:transcriptional regulator with XRE-family HTH domain
MRFRDRELGPGGSARQMYGAEIRQQRNRAGLTLTALAYALGYSKATLSRYETGESPIPPELPPRLDAALGTDGLFVRLYEVIRHDRFPDRYRQYMSLETQAAAIASYAASTIPGLLQTPAYARALFRAADVSATEAEIDERVQARVSRKSLFQRRPSPRFSAVVAESVLCYRVGGPTVMREQLLALLPWLDHANGTLQVMPFAAGEHAILTASQTVLTLEDGSSVVHVENGLTSQLFEDETTLASCQRDYDRMRAYALSPRESAVLIAAAAKEHESCVPRTRAP